MIVSSRNDQFRLSSLSSSTVTTTGLHRRDENKFIQPHERRTSSSQLGPIAAELYGIDLCNARETRSNSIGSIVARTQNQTQHCIARPVAPPLRLKTTDLIGETNQIGKKKTKNVEKSKVNKKQTPCKRNKSKKRSEKTAKRRNLKTERLSSSTPATVKQFNPWRKAEKISKRTFNPWRKSKSLTSRSFNPWRKSEKSDGNVLSRISETSLCSKEPTSKDMYSKSLEQSPYKVRKTCPGMI